MTRAITIDPITRLEGHGKITICLDDRGDVDRAFFQVPELRGFEAFCVGRNAEDMPQITSRICGVCPTAHHMAAARALDDLYQVEPTPAAKAIRKLFYNMFMFEDHLVHFYYLGGPDFVVGPDAPAAATEHPGSDRQGGRRHRQESPGDPQTLPRLDDLDGRQSHPSRSRPARRNCQGGYGREAAGNPRLRRRCHRIRRSSRWMSSSVWSSATRSTWTPSSRTATPSEPTTWDW